MIEQLWSTPVARYDLRPYFEDFEKATRDMVESFPKRTDSNLWKFGDDRPAFSELGDLVKLHAEMYSREVEFGEELIFWDGHFNEHEYGQLNAPHAHPLAKVVAIYYVRTLGKGHGDLLLQDPRAGVNWIDVLDDDGRGVMGSGRVFKRYTPKSGELFIVPAFVVHSVEPNLLRDQPSRMSIGINLFSRDFLRHFNPRI